MVNENEDRRRRSRSRTRSYRGKRRHRRESSSESERKTRRKERKRRKKNRSNRRSARSRSSSTSISERTQSQLPMLRTTNAEKNIITHQSPEQLLVSETIPSDQCTAATTTMPHHDHESLQRSTLQRMLGSASRTSLVTPELVPRPPDAQHSTTPSEPFPQHEKESRQPWSLQKPDTNAIQTSEDSKISHPEWIPWPPAGWFPEDAPAWWPAGWEWPPPHPEWIPWPPSHPESIPFPPQHPEWIPWPPAGWFPEEAPSWWPAGWEWPPPHPESIPWPPSHPESIPWPPQHPEWIPWPPANWFPEEAPAWWPENWEWPPPHPEYIPTNPDDLPYVASRDNRFHLFTRANPFISQPLLYENGMLLAMSNYDANKRTAVLVHDQRETATGQFNAILVPSLLAAADINVIIVDWSGGANSQHILTSFYALQSGRFVSRFLNWLRAASNGDLSRFHLIGLGVGGWNVGFISRILDSNVGYVTALNPYLGPAITRVIPPLNPDSGVYTEVIYTNAREPVASSRLLGDVNFYANGGRNMPGCGENTECNHFRAVFYFAESVQGGAFTGTQCASSVEALEGRCQGPATLNMGGLEPKIGSTGVFYLRTNAVPPFSLIATD